MIYPGYLLNPGDMFQVDPERVMYATGAPKDREDRVATRALRKRIKAQKEAATESVPEEASEESPAAPAAEEKTPEEAEKAKRKEHKTELSSILQQAKDLLANQKSDLAAKRKQSIRAFASTVRKSIGNVNRTAPEDLDSELQKLMSKLSVEEAEMLNKNSEPKFVDESEKAGPVSTENADKLLLRAALREIKENPVDASKPYATPWRPKPFMNAFAFIPRYLEVNHNICSAVYLRHPVARPNLAEVPSPFSYETSQLAFTWYLRRR
jgi:ribosomal protein S4